MRDWADNPIAMFLVLRACLWVAPVGARSAGIILRCRRSEELVWVGLGMMPRGRRDAAARVRRASRGRLRRAMCVWNVRHFSDGVERFGHQLGHDSRLHNLARCG